MKTPGCVCWISAPLLNRDCPVHGHPLTPRMPPVPSGTFVRKREESLVLVEFTPEADAELRMMAHARAAQDQDAAKIILEGKP